MKIDAYVLLTESPARFGLRVNMSGEYAALYLRVIALPEMSDSQVLRLALDNIAHFVESLETSALAVGSVKVPPPIVNVHLDDPGLVFCEGDLLVAEEPLQKSIDRLEALLDSPGDLQFQRDPNGGSMI